MGSEDQHWSKIFEAKSKLKVGILEDDCGSIKRLKAKIVQFLNFYSILHIEDKVNVPGRSIDRSSRGSFS